MEVKRGVRANPLEPPPAYGPAIVERVETFQAELVKRRLKWSKHHSNTAATLVIGMQSVKSRILERKLFSAENAECQYKECQYENSGVNV